MQEVLYRNKIKDVEAKASVMQNEADKAIHDKQRNAILLKKMQRANDELRANAKAVQEQLDATRSERDKLDSTLKKKDKEIIALKTQVDGLMTQLAIANDEAAMNTAMVKLREEVASKEQTIGELREKLETSERENDQQLVSFTRDFRNLQEESEELYNKTVTQFRWRVFILLILLDKKRHIERKVKVKAKVAEWLSGSKANEAHTTLLSVQSELEDSKNDALRMKLEGQALRERASSIAQAKEHLEKQQSELVRTTREVVSRDEQLESAAQAAEERALTATKRTEALIAEGQHLRWAMREAEARERESAADVVTLIGERDAVRAELAEARRREREATAGFEAAEWRSYELEAAVYAERADLSQRLVDAQQTARDGTHAMQRLRTLEGELESAHAFRAATAVANDKQRLLLTRLLELEGTFGPMLAPHGGETPYSRALHELTQHELHLPPPGRRTEPAFAALPPALMLPLPPLPKSSSLPMLRTGVPPAAEAARPLPVARGAARVAARKGVSVGSRSELRYMAAAQPR
jgi:chromosome segregation ATPase